MGRAWDRLDLDDAIAALTCISLEDAPQKDCKEFQWTDDEVELLLSVTYEYKVKNSAESIDWESVSTLMSSH